MAEAKDAWGCRRREGPAWDCGHREIATWWGGTRRDWTVRPTPTTKDGRKLCSNCGETGHDKTACKQPKTDFSKRVCWACKKTGHSSSQCPTKADVRTLQEEGDDEPAAAFMLEESEEEPYWAANAHRNRYHGAPTKLDNSFEALAADSDDDDNCDEVRIEPGHSKTSAHTRDVPAPFQQHSDDVARAETRETGPTTGIDHWARSRAMCVQPQVSIWNLPVRGPGPCCYRKCEARNRHCRAKLMEAFQAGVEKSWERAKSFQDAVEPQEEKDEAEDAVEPQDEKKEVTTPEKTSVFSFRTPQSSSMATTPAKTSVFCFCTPEHQTTDTPDTPDKRPQTTATLDEQTTDTPDALDKRLSTPPGLTEDAEVIDCDIHDTTNVNERFEMVDDAEAHPCCSPCEEEEWCNCDCNDRKSLPLQSDDVLTMSKQNEYNDDDVMKKIEHATYLRNLDMVMTEVYQSSSNDDDAKRQDSVKKDPRPNIYEELNFLDADDDEELHSAETANNEFLDVEIEIAADSGASEHVAADTDAPTYKVEESAGSRSGQHFVGAGGHRMANRGQMKLDMRADNGRKGRDVRTTFQVARVTRPLMSVSKICDAGMTMRFTSAMAVIEDNKGKEVCRFLRKGGLYIASMKLKNVNYKPPTTPFVRPGGK